MYGFLNSKHHRVTSSWASSLLLGKQQGLPCPGGGVLEGRKGKGGSREGLAY